MKKILFVNACIRENSRTEILARRYLAKIGEEYETEEIKLSEMNLRPLDRVTLSGRDQDIAEGRIDSERYPYAHQFAKADRIVIAAPYWDCLFPAVLRTYLENICVTGITFAYGEKGKLLKECRADQMTYITTSGGFLPEHSAVEGLIREMGTLFSISDVRFYAAQGLDVFPERVDEILKQTLKEMQEK